MEIEKSVNRENLIYRASEYIYSFKNFKTIKTFGRDIYNDEITLKEADNDQTNLLVEIMAFKKNTKPQSQKNKKKKKNRKKEALKNLYALFESRVKKVLDAFESKIFTKKNKGG